MPTDFKNGSQQEKDAYWMAHALKLADKAELQGEVPVGALIVLNDELIAEGWNQVIQSHDPTAHAEIIAIRKAGQVLHNYRLIETTLYVTLEPCPMCASSLVHARIGRLVYGAKDYKTGAVHSVMNLTEHGSMNHVVELNGGVLEADCSHRLSQFFRKRRLEKRQAKFN